MRKKMKQRKKKRATEKAKQNKKRIKDEGKIKWKSGENKDVSTYGTAFEPPNVGTCNGTKMNSFSIILQLAKESDISTWKGVLDLEYM
jgi:hypothetical protein